MADNRDQDDIRRSLEVLWGVEATGRRGRKPRVSARDVVKTAVEIADRNGLEAVSMRKVADAIGVTAMAIYSYVPNKSVLVDAMLDHVVAEMIEDAESVTGWRDGLYKIAHRTRAMHERHPWALHVSMTRRPFGPNTLAAFEAEMRVVSTLDLPPDKLIAIINTVDDYVHGSLAATLEVDKDEGQSQLDNHEWFEQHGGLLSQFADFSNYPTLAGLWETNSLIEYRSDFEFGLQRVLDGIEQYITAQQESAD